MTWDAYSSVGATFVGWPWGAWAGFMFGEQGRTYGRQVHFVVSPAGEVLGHPRLPAPEARQGLSWYDTGRPWSHYVAGRDQFSRAMQRRRKRLQGEAKARRSAAAKAGQRETIPDAWRRQVLTGAQCAWCGDATPACLVIDHVVPWSVMRRHDLWNLRALCRTCNGKRGARGYLADPAHAQVPIPVPALTA